jgi:hypothetical protein
MGRRLSYGKGKMRKKYQISSIKAIGERCRNPRNLCHGYYFPFGGVSNPKVYLID